MPADPIRVLFVCTHNSARSQIAEALLQRYGGADFEVFSAGTEVTQVNPYARRVIEEAGIDWSGARSKVDHRVPRPAVRLRHHGLRPRPGHLPGLPGIDEHAPLGPRRSVRGRGDRCGEAGRVPADRDRDLGPAPPVHRGRPPRRGPTQAPGPRLRAAAAESLGTFALVFFGCGAIANGLSPTSVALAFGLVDRGDGLRPGPHLGCALQSRRVHRLRGGAARTLAEDRRVRRGPAARRRGRRDRAPGATLGSDVDLGVTHPRGRTCRLSPGRRSSRSS